MNKLFKKKVKEKYKLLLEKCICKKKKSIFKKLDKSKKVSQIFFPLKKNEKLKNKLLKFQLLEILLNILFW